MKTNFKVCPPLRPPLYQTREPISNIPQFSNLLGTVYCQGNLLFDPDGTHLFSPVGNRVTVFNLVEYASPCPPYPLRVHY